MLDKSVAISEVHPNRLAAGAYLDHSYKLKKSLLASVAEQKVATASPTDTTVPSSPKREESLTDHSPPKKKKMMRKKKKKTARIPDEL